VAPTTPWRLPFIRSWPTTFNNDLRRLRQHGHGCEILLNVVGQLLVNGRRHGVVGATHKEGVAVRSGTGGNASAQCSPGATSVIHDNALVQLLAQLLRERPGKGVCAAASRERNDDGDRSFRPSRMCSPRKRHGGKGGCNDRHSKALLHCLCLLWFLLTRCLLVIPLPSRQGHCFLMISYSYIAREEYFSAPCPWCYGAIPE